ncbi:MAG: aldehyde dehydrogenase [Bacteroidota bacterium]|nr:aldehyde dehydrogenase [Bacteroidota bacterium]
MKEDNPNVLVQNISEEWIAKKVHDLRNFYASGKTKNIDFRIRQLKNLKAGIKKFEPEITKALWEDLHKSKEEAYLTEISIVLQEIDLHLKNLKNWGRPSKVPTPIYLKPSSGKIIYDPLGVALIIAPWNYPFQLLFYPLVGAISAGCCAIMKPSEFSPHISKLSEKMVKEIFEEDYISVAQGHQETGEALLHQRFDVIFFTGSSNVGKIVMKAAAEYLTPVILELGGKSPCIVDGSANIDIAAKRIAWGKVINAGQTCIAPDYLLVHESVKAKLLEKLAEAFNKMLGSSMRQSEHYGRIVNERAFKRLIQLLEGENIWWGGKFDEESLFISPTILDNVKPDSPIMQEEIFGPLLPVITFKEMDEALDLINSKEKPLALYYFGEEKKGEDVLSKTTSGGACINDTLMHISNHNLPFGGVGQSGLGKYHGKASFLAFSNQRAVVTTPTWIDVPFKYPPYKLFKLIKKIV